MDNQLLEGHGSQSRFGGFVWTGLVVLANGLMPRTRGIVSCIHRFGQFLKARSGTTLSKYELGNKKLDADDVGVIPFSRKILLNLANKLWFLERSFDATY
jgi:hypothetical protein